MFPRRDRLLPAVAFVVLASIGVLILLLIADASRNGRAALEESLQNEVEAIARSQNSRVGSQLSGVGGLANEEWDFAVESESDRIVLEDLLELVPDLRTGFFLTDPEGLITQGVGLADRSIVGTMFRRDGFEEAFTTAFATGSGALLPIDEGITASVPVTTFLFPIFDDVGLVRGVFVFESEVAGDSAFNEEIAELGRGESGVFLVYDVNGRVVASNDPSLLAQSVPDPGYLEDPTGLTTIDGDVRVIAAIPAAGWRISFTEDRDEFLEGLAGPLQQVGQVVVVVFVLIGLASFVALTRRLRAAREEQARLERLSESQEEFISIVSHELRTPVAGVVGFLQTTLDHWDVMSETERVNAVRNAFTNSRRLQGLTRDVLDSQSVASGQWSYSPVESDLRDEILAAVDAARTTYPELTFDVEVDVDAAPVSVDPIRIQQVFTNLFDNAAAVSTSDAPIELRLTRSDGRFVVTVADHGPGLSSELRENVFDKFVRGRTGSVAGTGLGLYIANQIVEAHDGSMSATNRPDGGAAFSFSVPARVGSAAD